MWACRGGTACGSGVHRRLAVVSLRLQRIDFWRTLRQAGKAGEQGFVLSHSFHDETMKWMRHKLVVAGG